MTMKSLRRTGVASAVIAALGASALSGSAASANPLPDDAGLLLHYDFAASTDGVVGDVSGNGNDGTILGTGATVADGALNLPGGAAASNAGHVRMPDSLFDGQDTLTISTWLRNDTGNGNYAAVFFGSGEGTLPAQYWLLNPQNTQGRVKSVITNGSAPNAPWSTESGISPSDPARGVLGPATGSEWAMHTTVITPTSIAGYYNGALVGEVPVTRTVSQFGTGLVGYIGRSTYRDVFYRGSVDDVIVSTTAYSAGQIADLYYSGERVDPEQTRTALESDAGAISVPAEAIADLRLPTVGQSYSQIDWTTSNTGAITADGRVTRPDTGQSDADVVLTATFTLGGQSLTRDYPVTVPAVDAQRDLDRTAASFELGIEVVADDISLLGSVDGATISWTSSDESVVAEDGSVTRSADDVEVELAAVFSRDGRSAERSYRVTVLAQDVGTVVSYVRGADTRTKVLHLAASEDGAPLVALNDDRGVLFPEFGTGTSRFSNPTLFRQPDGSYGMVASDDAANGRIFVYRSDDLVTYTDQRYVLTNTEGIVVSRADVAYDNGLRAYRIALTTPTGAVFEVVTRDFASFSDPLESSARGATVTDGLPAGAIEASAFRATRSELDTVQRSLGRIVNTSIDTDGDIEVAAGGELQLPERVQLGYSDGSSKQLGVQWDTSAVDLDQPGTYTVTGEVNQPVYGDEDGILVRERADPWVLRDDERTGEAEYYLTGSFPTTQANPGVGYDRLVLRRSDTINGLTGADEEVLLWARNAVAPDTSNGSRIATGAFRYFWAPELHKIGGDWYILFTASRGNGPFDIRPALIRAPGDSDPMVAANWEQVEYMRAAPGDANAFTSFSLDMTYFEANDRHYMIWAEKPGSSDLRMAEIDPADPSRLISQSILLSTPNFAWERTSNQVINEGAAVIKSETEVFVFFSGSEVNETYVIGKLRAPIDGDLLDPATWAKTGYPLLSSADFDGQQLGTGHNSFTIDADGNPVIVYHARPPFSEWLPGADGGLNDPSRHARVKTVHFSADGSAVLNQTREEELAPENRTVSLTVTVTDESPGLDFTAAVAERCVAGRVVHAVTVTNSAGVPISVGLTSPFGQRLLEAIPADRARTAVFTTRQASIDAGTLGLRATATVDGEAVSIEREIPYRAFSCG